MYSPPAYVVSDRALLEQFMREWSFATLITTRDGEVNATHLPFLVHPARGDKGKLVTHLAKANPQYADLCAGASAMVIFQGPQAFVSAGWYQNQQTFPTWNYTAVHVRGSARVIDEPQALRAVLQGFVERFDKPVASGWNFDNSPGELVASRMKVISGVEIDIQRIEGKMKLSQDKTAQDRQGVIAALESSGDFRDREMAGLMRRLP